jgi:hypothetical protein
VSLVRRSEDPQILRFERQRGFDSYNFDYTGQIEKADALAEASASH